MNADKTINKMMTWLVAVGALFCLVFAATLVYWGASRTAPFTLISYVAIPAKAGQTTIITGYVKRDVDRSCRVMFSRSMIDSAGVRYELSEGAQTMNASALRDMSLISPDRLKFTVNIPKNASVGKAHVFTSLDYECNPIHQFYPISISLDFSLMVLPP